VEWNIKRCDVGSVTIRGNVWRF